MLEHVSNADLKIEMGIKVDNFCTVITEASGEGFLVDCSERVLLWIHQPFRERRCHCSIAMCLC